MTVQRIRVAACVCTYQRNEPLRRLLDRLVEVAEHSAHRVEMAVVVVDDNREPSAEAVVSAYDGVFELGTRYAWSGQQNISVARSLALETALEFADLIVMTDDDCVPDVDWIDALLLTYESSGADSVSGRCLCVAPPEAPQWITDQQVLNPTFHEAALVEAAPLPIGQTNNCMISAAWLRDHPHHRFDPEFGRIGGEDMVFFSGAIALGMRSVHSERAIVRQHEPLEELSLAQICRARYWLGNSEAITNGALSQVRRRRLLARAGKRMILSATSPVRRALSGRPPYFRAAIVECAGAAGMMTGAFGFRVDHH